MVQRYEFCQWSNDEAGMQAESDGDWVKYEDYAALETKYENLLQIVRDSMRKIELEVVEDGD